MTKVKAKAEKITKLKFYKIHKEHEIPKFQTEQAACFDLQAQYKHKQTYEGYTANNVKFERVISENRIKIMSGERVMIPTGLILDIPKGYSVRIHPRSGLSLKVGLTMVNAEAVIDSDYFHETFILVVNMSHNPLIINHGDRIAQGELIPQLKYDLTETKSEPKAKTNRVGGLGSTDVTTETQIEEPKENAPSTSE